MNSVSMDRFGSLLKSKSLATASAVTAGNCRRGSPLPSRIIRQIFRFFDSSVGGRNIMNGSGGDSADGEQFVLFVTLGDGDFSWSLDLARHLAANWAKHQSIQLIATGIDSASDLQNKYRSDAEFAVRELKRIGNENNNKVGKNRLHVQVRHEVNAIVNKSALPDEPCCSSGLPKADVLIFNHPHLGTEDAQRHGQFLCHLFDSVQQAWLAKQGIFYLTLAKDQFERWKCMEAACRSGMEIIERYVFVPCPAAIPDPYYKHRRHQSGKSFANRTSGSETFAFVRTQDTTTSTVSRYPVLPWFSKEYGETDHACKGTGSSCVQETPSDHSSFLCPHCEKSFREERSLKNHIQSKHSKSNRDHKRKWTENESSPIACPLCREESSSPNGSERRRVFADQEALNAHIRAKHEAIHTTILPEWAEANMNESISDCSSSRAPTGSVKPFRACHICGQVFYSQEEEQEHHKQFVPSQSPADVFVCRFCLKRFPQRRAQLQHENFCRNRTSKHLD